MKQPLAHKTLTKEEFFGLLINGFALDARLGGYVIGQSHEEGGIKCFTEINDRFEMIAEIEGGEYILNGGCVNEFEEQIMMLNANYETDSPIEEPLCISDFSSMYNTKGTQEKILWVSGGGFIMNKYATRKYFQILEKMNFISNPLRHYSAEE